MQKTDVILLHSGKQARWVWDELRSALAVQQSAILGRVIALDVIGCGAKRGVNSDGLHVDHVAADLIAELNRFNISRAMIVGHSHAGTILPTVQAACRSFINHAVYVACVAPSPWQSIVSMFDNGRQGEFEGEIGWPVDRESVSESEFLRQCSAMT